MNPDTYPSDPHTTLSYATARQFIYDSRENIEAQRAALDAASEHLDAVAAANLANQAQLLSASFAERHEATTDYRTARADVIGIGNSLWAAVRRVERARAVITTTHRAIGRTAL